MPQILEHDTQRALCGWLDGWPKRGVPTKPVMLLPGVEYWHTPNGGTRRDAFEGKRLKEIGLKPGIHDLLFLRRAIGLPYGLLFGLELKRLGEHLSDSQLDMHPRLVRAGIAGSAMVDNLADAKRQLFEWGLTVNGY